MKIVPGWNDIGVWPTILIRQVCGLKWSRDDRELASGGNDNQVTFVNLIIFMLLIDMIFCVTDSTACVVLLLVISF